LSSSRPTNTSRAYWELKAEQVMDRVFAGAGRSAAAERPPTPTGPRAAEQAPIDVEVHETSSPGQRPWRIRSIVLPPRLGLALAGCISGLSLVGGFGLWQGWNQARQDLRQERTLRLLEGIRNLGSAERPLQSENQDEPATSEAARDALPPPPPSEAWIQELGQLEARSPVATAPLQVPLNGTLQAPAPPAPAIATPSSTMPELLGVVQIPGKPGSAIFQVGGSSTSAMVGEVIGSSGWTLSSTDGDSAVISRGGLQRHVSISSGF
jgi:hypothetical protein